MKSLYGRLNKLCVIFVLFITFVNTTVFASDKQIEFVLESANCGNEIIQATYGNAQLSASADGVNKEKIRWDDDVSMLAPRMQGKKLATGWHFGGYWMIEFSAENLENLKFSADMFSSGKGPKDFEMYYSIDGAEFNKIDNSEIELSKNNSIVYDNFSLPTAIEGQANVYIKIMISSDIGVNGNTITGIKDGSTYINNIIIAADSESISDADNKQEDNNKQDSDEENTEKAYYTVKKNIEMSRIGLPTGKYKFSVKISAQ